MFSHASDACVAVRASGPISLDLYAAVLYYIRGTAAEAPLETQACDSAHRLAAGVRIAARSSPLLEASLLGIQRRGCRERRCLGSVHRPWRDGRTRDRRGVPGKRGGVSLCSGCGRAVPASPGAGGRERSPAPWAAPDTLLRGLARSACPSARGDVHVARGKGGERTGRVRCTTTFFRPLSALALNLTPEHTKRIPQILARRVTARSSRGVGAWMASVPCVLL